MFGGAPRSLAIASLVQLAIGLPLCYALASYHGAVGAATGLAVGEVVGIGVVLPALAARDAKIRYVRHFGRCLFAMAATGVWCLVMGQVVGNLVDIQTPMGLLVGGMVWGLIGFVPAVVLAIPPTQRALLIGLLWPSAVAILHGLGMTRATRRL